VLQDGFLFLRGIYSNCLPCLWLVFQAVKIILFHAPNQAIN
jgi:hypothetical protein